MPDNDDDVLELDHEGENEKDNEMENQIAESGNLAVAMTALANEFGASAARRASSADQLASDSQRMWAVNMTTPSVMAAHGMRIASEAGAGRTRVEANTPAGTQTTGG